MQSSRSVEEITYPTPDDIKSTCTALFFNLFKNPCMNETLISVGICLPDYCYPLSVLKKLGMYFTLGNTVFAFEASLFCSISRSKY